MEKNILFFLSKQILAKFTCRKSKPSVINKIFVSLLRRFSKRIWYPTSGPYWVSVSRATLFDSDTQAILRGWVHAVHTKLYDNSYEGQWWN